MSWIEWHESYKDPNSSLSRRLAVVRQRIIKTLDTRLSGPIHVISMCAGDGRDLLGVLDQHSRAADVTGRLVELDPHLAERARQSAPVGIEVCLCDAGNTDAYKGTTRADLLLCCGVFGNVTEEDIQRTIEVWPMLCAPGATVIWTRGAFQSDIRQEVRRWVTERGFEEIAFDGPPERFGVGVARMVCASKPYRPGERIFTFRDDRSA